MKIIALNSNYDNPTATMHNGVTVMTDSSLAKSGKPWFVPDFAESFSYTPHIVLRIGRLGKNIGQRFALRYIDAVTVGCTVNASGLNGALGNAFDGAAMLGEMLPIEQAGDLAALTATVTNGSATTVCRASEMAMPIDEIIAWVSRYFTLKIGDLIYTGATGVFTPLTIGDTVRGSINGEALLDIRIK